MKARNNCQESNSLGARDEKIVQTFTLTSEQSNCYQDIQQMGRGLGLVITKTIVKNEIQAYGDRELIRGISEYIDNLQRQKENIGNKPPQKPYPKLESLLDTTTERISFSGISELLVSEIFDEAAKLGLICTILEATKEIKVQGPEIKTKQLIAFARGMEKAEKVLIRSQPAKSQVQDHMTDMSQNMLEIHPTVFAQTENLIQNHDVDKEINGNTILVYGSQSRVLDFTNLIYRFTLDFLAEKDESLFSIYNDSEFDVI